MSIDVRMSRQGTDPKATITLVGDHDIIRFCANLLFDQCEFAALGRKVLRSRRRAYGKRWAGSVRWLFGESDHAKAVMRGSARVRRDA